MARKNIVVLGLILVLMVSACSPGVSSTDLPNREDQVEEVESSDQVSVIEQEQETETPPSPVEEESEPPQGVEPLPEPNPVDLTIKYEEDNTAEIEIGYEGGGIEVTAADGTRFILEIPPEALFSPETIRMTPATAVDGIPFDSEAGPSVKLEPESLVFYKPALLRIQLPDGGSAEGMAAYSTFPAGKDFHLYPGQQETNEVQLYISHFSNYGLIEQGIKDEVARVKGQYTPSQAETYARDQAFTILELVDDPDAQVDAIEKIQRQWFYNSVITRLKNAAVFDDRIDQAVGEFLAWLEFARMFDVLIGTDGELEKRLEDEIEMALDAIAVALKNGFERAFQRCTQENNPDEALKMLRWGLVASYLEVWGRQGFDQDKAQEMLLSCFNFDFVLRSRVEGKQGNEGFISQVLATIPLKVKQFDYYGGLVFNSDDLTFEINQLQPGHPNCEETSKTGRLGVSIIFNLNLRLAEPSIKQGLKVIMGVLERPEEGVRCTTSGVTVENPVLRWMPMYHVVNSPFFDGAFYNYELPIVSNGEVYAELELHGPIPDVPDGKEKSTYQLLHKPER